MHEELWKQLDGLDRAKTSQGAKCRYEPDSDCYVITLLNREYAVDLSEKRIFSGHGSLEQEAANYLEQLCILAYLINAKELPLAGELVRAASFPGGAFFFRGQHELPTQKLAEVFGATPDLLYKACVQLDAKRCNFGDASIELLVLPRVPLTFVIWAGDDEFDARASILFDRTASEQLLLDALLTAVNLAVSAIIRCSTKDN